jgi:hypothetical protein
MSAITVEDRAESNQKALENKEKKSELAPA